MEIRLARFGFLIVILFLTVEPWSDPFLHCF